MKKSTIMLKNISKSFKKRGYVFKALDNVSISLNTPSLVVISGNSGSGKTTLLNILGGLDSQTSGTFSFNGKMISKKETDKYRSNNVSFVFQEYNLLIDSTIRENLKLAFELNGSKYNEKEAKQILARVGLPDEGEDIGYFFIKKPMELSGGQRQRVAIARALIKKPEVLLLDEPTGALDKNNSECVIKLAKELSKDRLVVLSTHDVNEAEPYADRIIRLEKGKIIEDKTFNKNAFIEPLNREEKKKRAKFHVLLRRAFSGLKNNKIKLAISLALSLLITTTLGVITSFQTVDSEIVALRTQYEKSKKRKFFLRSMKGDGIDTWEETFFDEKQKTIIREYSGAHKPTFLVNNPFYLHLSDSDGEIPINNPCSNFVWTSFGREYAIPLSDETKCENLGIKRDPRLKDTSVNRLPSADDEIAITDLMADELLAKGVYSYESDGASVGETLINFSCLDDILGMEIGYRSDSKLKIVGIYKTEDDAEKWGKLRMIPDDRENYNVVTWGLASTFSPGQLMIVNNSFSQTKNKVVMLELSGNLEKDIKLRKQLESKIDGSSAKRYVNVFGEFTGVTGVLNIFENSFTRLVITIGALIFLITDILLSLNLFFSNVRDMEKELGILRALGASKADIGKIVYLQGLFVSGFNLLISLLLVWMICEVTNSSIAISALAIDSMTFFVILALTIFTMVIVTGIASIRAINQKPINVIENK